VRPAWIVPDWPAPPGVRAAALLRSGGVSPPPWDSLNLGDHVGDDPARVAENRRLLRLALALPGEPAWLSQVHGTDVLVLDDRVAGSGSAASAGAATEPDPATSHIADAAVTGRPGEVLAVLTADCLPVLFSRADGTRIGIAHAGWRGLAAGVLEATFTALEAPPGEVMAWIGPGIGAAAYEVGDEVRDACLAAAPASAESAATCFSPGRPGRWHFDLAGLARLRLAALGLAGIHGGSWCTFSDPARFYSHRRDGATGPTGRMATLIWRDLP
jgi:polyphenol oxidase